MHGSQSCLGPVGELKRCGDMHRGSQQWAEPLVPGLLALAYVSMLFYHWAFSGMGEVAVNT